MQQFFHDPLFEKQPPSGHLPETAFQTGWAGLWYAFRRWYVFCEKRKTSAGVKRQYWSRLSKTENCQSGIFLAFAGDNGYGLVDYELYLPREWYSGLFQFRWVGCDEAYGNDHAFLDGLKLPEGVWYFAAANAKEQVFPEYPQMSYPETKRGRLRKHPIFDHPFPDWLRQMLSFLQHETYSNLLTVRPFAPSPLQTLPHYYGLCWLLTVRCY